MAFGPTPAGNCSENINQVTGLISPTIMNYEVNGTLEVEFEHIYSLETSMDGGIVSYSVDDGATWDVVNTFYLNGYDGQIFILSFIFQFYITFSNL